MNRFAADLAHLKRMISSGLNDYVPEETPCALVDFPNHNNSGDSAIWLGELSYLRFRSAIPKYVCDRNSYSSSDLYRLVPEGPILLHGGGNFGDLWPAHHTFRQQVVHDFPHRTIVQLPQTVRINEAAINDVSLPRSQRGGKTIVFCRDETSLQLASSISGVDHAQLLPDMALFLPPMERHAESTHDITWIARSDHERKHAPPRLSHGPLDIQVADWLCPTGPDRLYRATSVRIRNALSRVASASRSNSAYSRTLRRLPTLHHPHFAYRRMRTAVVMLQTGNVVVSDRLHAHILCLLLGIPNVVLDDKFRKTTGFFDVFTHGIDGTVSATSPVEALDAARNLMAN